MEDDQDKPGEAAPPEKPPKIKANENPWYLLATLYGEPADEPDKERCETLRDRNRIAGDVPLDVEKRKKTLPA